MEYVNVFSVIFNIEENHFEANVNRNAFVTDYNEYNDVLTVAGIPVSCKLDSIKITEMSGYLVTNQNLSDIEGISKVLKAFKEKCNDIINSETEKLNYLTSLEESLCDK